MSDIVELNLQKFISEEKQYFSSLNTEINWSDEKLVISSWFYYGNSFYVSQSIITKSVPTGFVAPPKQALPCPFSDFVKSLAVYLYRTKGIGFMAVRNYINECRRLYIFMYQRNETSPLQLTRWHFERTVEFMKEISYKNIYDSAANLQVIAEIMDKKQLTPCLLDFKHGLKSEHKYHRLTPLNEITDDQKRKDEDKLPSYEAMQAYAVCTNNPINNHEEILLRTIDLIIAMGQRGNEVAILPFDCWIEKKKVDKYGNVVFDAHKKPIVKTGIRYYAEKQFQSRIHWLAQQDIPFAERAVNRLKELTKEIRETARWQEENPGRLWNITPTETITDDSLLQYLGFVTANNLQLYLTKRNNIKPVFIDKNKDRPFRLVGGIERRYTRRYHYLAGQIEHLLSNKLNDHIVLKENIDGKWHIILKTSDTLSIRPDGAYRFKRGANTFNVLPGRTLLSEINGALGSIKGIESIFERRCLTEADGSKIKLTSHTSRHWRNTLYELAGMSDVQQKLAMGRQKINQNHVYQHTTLEERTKLHKEFLSFISPTDRVSFLHDGIRNKTILGDITQTYHSLKQRSGIDKVEFFLKTHSIAMHLTPFGGCTHDFSQAPCTKHLQCWNGCSHLHRTNTPGEKEHIEEQLELSKKALQKMEEDSDEYGQSVWKEDLQKKIINLEKGIKIEVSDSPTPVFPDGIPVTLAVHERKTSSIKND